MTKYHINKILETRGKESGRIRYFLLPKKVAKAMNLRNPGKRELELILGEDNQYLSVYDSMTENRSKMPDAMHVESDMPSACFDKNKLYFDINALYLIGAEKNARFIGINDFIEIWNPESYEKYEKIKRDFSHLNLKTI